MVFAPIELGITNNSYKNLRLIVTDMDYWWISPSRGRSLGIILASGEWGMGRLLYVVYV
ncbi:MAG TPA: hypothetical protein V6D14_09135 [Coleofasciculaceae cyanobacterium]